MRVISASNIEKYSYCPKSWQLSLEGHSGQGKEIEEGILTHEDFSEKLNVAREESRSASEWEKVVLIFSIVAMILAFYSMFITYPRILFKDDILLSRMYNVSAAIWVAAAVGFFIRSRQIRFTIPVKMDDNDPRKLNVKTGLSVVAAAVVLLINTTTLFVKLDPLWAPILIFLAILWLLISLGAVYYYRKNMDSRNGKIMILALATGATILASNGITMKVREDLSHSSILAQFIILDAIVMLFLGIVIIFYSIIKGWRMMDRFIEEDRDNVQMNQSRKEESRAALYLSIVSIVLGTNSILIKASPTIEIAIMLEIVSIVWIIAAVAAVILSVRAASISRSIKEQYKLKKEDELTYIDDNNGKVPLLRCTKLGLSGRPDAIIREGDSLIPVELKTGKIPRVARFSHIMQVGTYCVLVENVLGKKPPYGIIKYQSKKGQVITVEYKIAYDEKMKELVINTAEEMRAILKGEKEAHRNHNKLAKCLHCSRNSVCDEKLG